MKKYVLAIAIASSALLGLSAQAAPVSSAVSGVQGQVTGDAVKVFHCRGWSGGWGWRRLGRPQPVLEPSPLGFGRLGPWPSLEPPPLGFPELVAAENCVERPPPGGRFDPGDQCGRLDR